MGRGQLKYRKRGGGRGGGLSSGRGSGRGVGDGGSATAASGPSSRTKRGGGGGGGGGRGRQSTAHLPSNTEKWGRAFGDDDHGRSDTGRGGYSAGRGVGVVETERLLDESEWATGVSRFAPQEDDYHLTAAERDGAALGGLMTPGEMLSLDVGLLAACLQRFPVNRRLRLPPAYTAELEDDDNDRVDSSLGEAGGIATTTKNAAVAVAVAVGCQDSATTIRDQCDDEGRSSVATASTTKTPEATVGTPGGIGAAAEGRRGGAVGGEEIHHQRSSPTSETLCNRGEDGVGVRRRGGRVVAVHFSPAGADSDGVLETLLGLEAAGPSSLSASCSAVVDEAAVVAVAAAATGDVVNRGDRYSDDSDGDNGGDGGGGGVLGEQQREGLPSSSSPVHRLTSPVPMVEPVVEHWGGGGGGGTAVAGGRHNSISGGAGVVREVEGIVGRGRPGGGVAVGGGVEDADELEDWLDDMLADS